MGQIGQKLRRFATGYWHWCPGCQDKHPLPDSWSFDGNVDQPTFSPSFRQNLGAGRVCHYFVRAGQLEFCGDSTHALAGKTVPLPELPAHLRDAV